MAITLPVAQTARATGASRGRLGSVPVIRFPCHVQRPQSPSVRAAAKKVAVPPPTPVDVEALFAAATCYSALLTVYLLLTATAAMLRPSKSADGDEVTYIYSTNAIGRLSRGKRVTGRGANGGSMRQALVLLLPLIAVYGVLLVNSYSPDTLSLVLPGSLKEGLSGGFNPQFIPKLANISTLFSRVGVTASLWVHLLAVNAFCAFTLMHRGLAAGIPVHHTIVLSMVFGPLGFLSSYITERLRRT